MNFLFSTRIMHPALQYPCAERRWPVQPCASRTVRQSDAGGAAGPQEYRTKASTGRRRPQGKGLGYGCAAILPGLGAKLIIPDENGPSARRQFSTTTTSVLRGLRDESSAGAQFTLSPLSVTTAHLLECLVAISLNNTGRTTPVGSVPVTSTSSTSGTGDTNSAGSVGILLDDEGDEVYKCMEDFQRCRFEPFVAEAEAKLQKLMELCGLLEVALDEVRVATKPSSTDKGGDPTISARRFLADGLHRRLALYRVLFKESWGLATTYCVFK